MDSDAKALKKLFIEAALKRGKEFAAKRKEVQGNSKLSDSGKADEIAKINAEAREALDAIMKRYKAELAKGRETHMRTLNGPTKPLTALDKLRMKINKAPAMEFEYLDDDSRAAALIESNQAVIEALKKSSLISVAARMDSKELADAMAHAFEAGNMNALEGFAEVASVRGDQDSITRGQTYITTLKEQSLSPAQKRAKLELERLDIHEAIFEDATQKVLIGKDLEKLEAMFAQPGQSDERIDMQIAQIQSSTKAEE
ncbi:MAG: hypothetical protein KJ002_02570 [Candidatus Dadabacteria bacterium]|nr:hypothetical protein [Candidatus Dadabacteria bacterium]